MSMKPFSWPLLFVLCLPAGVDGEEPLPFVFRDVSREAGLLPTASGIKGHGAGWGDIDNDGWPDLYIATFHYPDTRANLLFRNRDGKLELSDESSVQISTRGTGVLFVDLDNDGDLDLYVGSMPGPPGSRLAQRVGRPLSGCSLFRNDGDGKFTNVSADNAACPPAFGGRSATTLDYNGDGLLDLLVGEDPLSGYNGSPTKTSRLFKNLGQLKFEDVSESVGIGAKMAGLGVAAADINVDGWPDLLLASTLGNYLLLNDGTGKFKAVQSLQETFAWPTAKGDDMVCGIASADVNNDGLPDIVVGQHYSQPWVSAVPNRLYLHRGVVAGVPQYEDVTAQAGLVPLPLKGPHVELQDFDNDGLVDIYTSIVKFAGTEPHPLIFRNTTTKPGGLPQFKQSTLGVNDFPTDADRQIKRSGTFFEKMVQERKVTYTAAGPTGDFNRDGRLDIVLASWWPELPSMLLRNDSDAGNWLDVQLDLEGERINRMGIGARVIVYSDGRYDDDDARIGAREISAGYGYASGQEAIAHFGLGIHDKVDVKIILPHHRGVLKREQIQANQRLRITLQQGASK